MAVPTSTYSLFTGYRLGHEYTPVDMDILQFSVDDRTSFARSTHRLLRSSRKAHLAVLCSSASAAE